MKNPFAMMAMMAAAMSMAWRENKFRDAGISLPAAGRSRVPGKPNPAGSKLVMRFFKAKHGHKAQSLKIARAWYAAYLSGQDALVRAADARRRYARATYNATPLKLAA